MEAVTRRYDAVVFDLFGTLVPEFSRMDFFQAVRAAADRLGCDREAFEREWSRTAMLRQTGAYPGGMEENARAIVASLGGAEPTAHAVAEALAPRDELYDRWFHPRDGALETLREVKTRGYPVALVSMCAPDTPERWRASDMAPFVDVTVFSSETGLRKPNAEIYLAACDGLGVEPDRCVYCGDGAYGELSGAVAVGMTAYLIRPPDLDVDDALTPEPEEDWRGPSIADLRELLDLLPAVTGSPGRIGSRGTR
jgi:putative hydrolase of the HAD superfamily